MTFAGWAIGQAYARCYLPGVSYHPRESSLPLMPQAQPRDSFLATGFRDVDRADVGKMARCLDALQSMACFQRYKDRSLELLGPGGQRSALDVGCGLGDDVVRLKRTFARAVGVDASAVLIAEALCRHGERGCEFVRADAGSLPFGDQAFDIARVDRSLQHMSDPFSALTEMVRVTRDGGQILCAEPDWGTFFLGTTFSETTRAVQDHWIRSFRNPWIGRNLFGMMKAAGVRDLSVEGHLLLTEGFAESDLVFDIAGTIAQVRPAGAAEAGWSDWLDGYRRTEALAGVMLFLCHGRKG